jgi:hypothetical protein
MEYHYFDLRDKSRNGHIVYQLRIPKDRIESEIQKQLIEEKQYCVKVSIHGIETKNLYWDRY